MRRWMLLYGISLVAILASCQRVIDIKVQDQAQLLVIEGGLSNQTGVQTISLSKSVAYDAANVYPTVSGAVVTVTNNNRVYTFTETKPGQYTNSTLRSRSGQSYTLNVQTAGQTYTATSIAPSAVALDSIGVSALNFGRKTVKTISVFYKDPVNEVNQYRFIIYVNGVQVKEIFAVDDYLTNGRYVNNTLYQDDITLQAGDKVEVEMQCIDKNVYNYFYNLAHQGGNSPNNSATPSNPTSNLSNGALGYFSAYITQRKSLIVL